MVHLHTLGRFELRADQSAGSDASAAQPKRLALLAYLAVATPRGFHRRDLLLGLFWPDLGPEEARRALWQALHHLRQIVGSASITTRTDDQIGLSAGQVWCDVVEFERLLDAHAIDDALAAYQGKFLSGVFLPDVSADLEEWIDLTRRRLQDRAVTAAWELAARESAAGRMAEAADAASRAFALAPEEESDLRRTLELLGRAGRRAEAMAVAEQYARRLSTDFGETLAPETAALVERIRTAPLPATPLTAPAPPQLIVTSSPASVAVTDAPVTRRRPRGVAWLVAGFVAVAVIAPALRAWLAAPTLMAEGTLTARDRILVADFVDRTPDSTLGVALTEAFRVDLAQSPLVRIMTSAQVHGALQRMERPLSVWVDDSLARTIALREGVKAFVTGEVSAVGPRFILSTRMVATLTGDELIALRETAVDSADLIPAIDRLSTRMRTRIGETIGAIHANPPLSEMTTPSLEALRLYTRAIHAKDVDGDREAAVLLLNEAVKLDTSFATAYWMLGTIHSALGHRALSDRMLGRAVAQGSRLPLRERYLITGSYHRNVTGDLAKAEDAYRALLALYPNDLAGLNNLGLVLTRQRQYAASEALYRRAIATDSTIPVLYTTLAELLALQSHFDGARETLAQVRQRFPDYRMVNLSATYVATAEQDWPAAAQHSQRWLADAGNAAATEMSALVTLAQIELVGGRLSDAEGNLRKAMAIAQRESSGPDYLDASMVLAWLELRYRRHPQAALERIDAALARYPLEQLEPADRPYARLGELLAALEQHTRLAALVAEVERDTVAVRAMGPAALSALRGSAALAGGDAPAAVNDLLDAGAADRCPVCTLPLLAAAYQQSGQTDKAIDTYERYLGTPWIWRFETDAPNLGWSIQRLGALYRERGQGERAAVQDARLDRLWGAADPEVHAMRLSQRQGSLTEGK